MRTRIVQLFLENNTIVKTIVPLKKFKPYISYIHKWEIPTAPRHSSEFTTWPLGKIWLQKINNVNGIRRCHYHSC